MPRVYDVSETEVPARTVAGVRARVARDRISLEFGAYLNQVYAAARSGAVALDGQNIFIYHNESDGLLTVDFCVGITAPFTATGAVVPTQTPAGVAATTVHIGDYKAMGGAHDAVHAWCRANKRELAGPSWEVYGHWNPDPAQCRTDIFYLLRRPQS